MKRFAILVDVALAAAALSGCAHGPGVAPSPADTQALFAAACPANSFKPVHGSVWMSVNSRKVSGKFPASVEIPDLDHVKMEITDLIGSPQAVVTVDGKNYLIESLGKNQRMRREKGARSWGGIPLEWAARLFSGLLPCPTETAPEEARLSTDEKGRLIVKTPTENFVYTFRSWAGKPWPESLHWEQSQPSSNRIDFNFDDPDKADDKPRKWEAKSDLGEVKVRWKDREL